MDNVITVDEEIDVALLERQYFEDLVADQVPWAVVFAYYLPEGIVFENIKIEHKRQWRQQKRALTINSQVNLTQAFSLWRDGDEYKARKRVFFVCQMTIFATQLVATNTVFDWWHEANSLRPILFDAALKSWDDFMKVWRPLYDFLVERFIDLRNAYRHYETEFLTSAMLHRSPNLQQVSSDLIKIYESTLDLNICLQNETWKKGSTKVFLAQPALTHLHTTTATDGDVTSSALTLAAEAKEASNFASPFPAYAQLSLPLVTLYVRARGLASLPRDLAINCKRHPIFPNLIHLSRTALLTPVDSVIAAECHGLVLDELADYAPVAFSHHLEYQTSDEGPVHLSPHVPITITRNFNAPLIEMFYYQGEWRLATIETVDASETSKCPSEISSQKGNSEDSSSAPSDEPQRPSFASLFWSIWSNYEIDMEQLDKTCCYSFWLLHPNARLYVLHERQALVFEGCTRWTKESGLVDIPFNEIHATLQKLEKIEAENESRFGASTDAILANLASKQWNGDSTTNVWGAQPLGNPLDLEIGGFKISVGKSRFARVFVPCAYLLRIQEIEKLQGDFLMQELEVLRLLVEQGEVASAWSFPLVEALPTFNLVAPPLVKLVAMLEAFVPKIGAMTQDQVRKEADERKAEGHFIFLLKSLNPTPASAFAFLKDANPRRMRKYLANWWTKEHSKAPPRTTTQHSYKGGHHAK